MTDSTSCWDFDGKKLAFGLQPHNYKTKIQEYPCVRIPVNGPPLAYEWCQEQLHNNWIWSQPLQANYVDMYFIHTEDAVTFKLKFLHT